jgi:CDK inhibitor PHO81
VLPAQSESNHGLEILDPQTSLQANKATFFFRVVSIFFPGVGKVTHGGQERELEKVNTFYLQKEAEVILLWE